MSKQAGRPPSNSKKLKSGGDKNTKDDELQVLQENYFNWLPTEMVSKILDKAIKASSGSESVLMFRSVCKQWNTLMRSKTQLGGILNDATISTVAKIHPDISLKTFNLTRMDQNRIENSCQTRFNLGSNNEQVNKFDPELFERSVEHLIIGGDVGAFLQVDEDQDANEIEEPRFSLSTGFAEDHRLLQEVSKSIRGTDLASILPHLKNVKVLTLCSIAFLSVPRSMMKQLNFSEQFSTITKLDICFGENTDIQKLKIFLEKAVCPNLLSFYIRVYANCFHLQLLISYYSFIAEHPQLKNLSISHGHSSNQIPQVLKYDSRLEIRHYPHLVKKLQKIKLECFRLSCIAPSLFGEIARPWMELEKTFLKNQTTLLSLELQFCHTNHRVDDLLPACEETLERLEISSVNTALSHFDCLGIANFQKLSQCHLEIDNPCPRCFIYDTDGVLIPISGISHIHELPPCIRTLHLGEMPNIRDIRLLKNRLINLNRITYVGPEKCRNMSPAEFFINLVEHLQFPSLVEYRIYSYSCSALVDALNSQKGLVCYAEDGGVTVFVDKEDFNLEEMMKNIKLPGSST